VRSGFCHSGQSAVTAIADDETAAISTASIRPGVFGMCLFRIVDAPLV
jgi:hypothetical protein